MSVSNIELAAEADLVKELAAHLHIGAECPNPAVCKGRVVLTFHTFRTCDDTLYETNPAFSFHAIAGYLAKLDVPAAGMSEAFKRLADHYDSSYREYKTIDVESLLPLGDGYHAIVQQEHCKVLISPRHFTPARQFILARLEVANSGSHENLNSSQHCVV